MHCPYCQTPAQENQAACSRCGFSLERVERYFGVMQRYGAGINDHARVLKPAESREIKKAITHFQERLPQCRMVVALVELDREKPLNAWAFWVLNRSGLVPELEKGSECRHIFLAVDVAGMRATMVVGYGLEPFLSQKLLDDTLAVGRDAFTNKEWGTGLCQVIRQAESTLVKAADDLSRVYGLTAEELGGPQPAPLQTAEAY